ncbi:hypothetical protein [Desulfovibrio sp. JC010]|uniref:hypothetical protein n=1 Tax=Desulfovibrio sp. JC010 TaxID=2593641 RepID=UPI0013D099C3|nr:hypothetical protein [Desulfovibrio sp. JC010]NDV28053.1 hypothetical protein [Desulfovibrio sp. JC010]
MRYFQILLSCTLLAIILSCAAKKPQPQADSHLEAAYDFVEITFNIEAAYQAFYETTLTEAEINFKESKKLAKYSDIILKTLKDSLQEDLYELRAKKGIRTVMANTYVNEFTEKELTELVKAHETNTRWNRRTILLPKLVKAKKDAKTSVLTLLDSKFGTESEFFKKFMTKVKQLQEQGQLPE